MSRLQSAIADALARGDFSIRELREQTSGRFSARQIEAALFPIADAVLVAPEGQRAFRARMSPEFFDSWPRGVAPEVVAAWENLTWRRACGFGVVKGGR